jgi:YVTN family beta-propeller protein
MKATTFALGGLAALVVLSAATAAPGDRAPAYHVIKKIKVGGDGFWDYLTMDADAHRLYVSHADRVVVLNVEDGTTVGEVANTPGVHGIALAPKLGRGFTSNGRENTVTIFSLDSLKEIGRVKVGSNPDAIMFDPASGRVFTFNGRSNDTTAVDAATGQVVGTLALGGKPEFAVTDGKGEIFVNIEDKSEIVAFDARKLTELHRWSIAPGEEPSGLALDARHRRLFAVCGNEKMAVVDADSGKVVATPAIGHGPDAAAFDRKHQLAFSSNGQDGTLTVLHEDGPNTFKTVATVPTQRGARTMALDEKTGRIYLATAEFGPPVAGQRRPSMIPGSFTILVVGE